MKISKKIISLATSYTLAAFLIMGGFIYKYQSENALYLRYIENNYQRAFAEFVTSVGEMDSALQKSLYSTSPSMTSAVCTELFGKAMSAQMAMGELPFDSYQLEHTASFITKVGDYAYMLSRAAAGGSAYTDEQMENLRALSESASVLSQNLIQLYADVNDGVITISELQSSQKKIGDSEDDTVPTNLADSFKTMESEFPEIPTLIYDGPFSEHIQNRKPRLIEHEKEISQEEAIQICADFFKIESDKLEVLGTRDKEIPVYLISSSDVDNELAFEVTVQGGFILDMYSSRSAAAENISEEDAVKIAEKFLSERGFDSMRDSYWTKADNILLINFAYAQDDIVCYTDLVKVAVALDNGSIVGFESLGYVMNHSKRNIPQPAVSEETAKSAVPSDLKILSHELCIIPTDGKYEKFCHEFKCETKSGSHLIIYVNAETGAQEKILILLENENGTLTL